MRISTASFFNASLNGMQEQQFQIAKLSQKIAENRSFLTSKEAPIDASRAMDLSNSLALRKQYQANQDNAELALKHESVHLDSLYTSLTSIRSAMRGISGGNDQNLRDQLAIEVSNLYKTIKDLGNATDSQGNYIFAGFSTDTAPVTHTQSYPSTTPSGATTYVPDMGVRNMTIENGRTVQTNDSLSAVFLGSGAWDLLQDLDNAAVALHDGTLTPAAVQSALDSAIGTVNSAVGALQNTQTQVSGRMLEIADVRSATKDLVVLEQNALGSLTELDMNSAIIQLQQRQTNLEASQRTYALVSQLSLFDFIG